jgi:hypothetical protein
LNDEGSDSLDHLEPAMTTIRTALRRIFAGGPSTEDGVHFHRRSDRTEPCYDPGCKIPRLTV